MKNFNWLVKILRGMKQKISTTNEKKNNLNLKNKIPISKPINMQSDSNFRFFLETYYQ